MRLPSFTAATSPHPQRIKSPSHRGKSEEVEIVQGGTGCGLLFMQRVPPPTRALPLLVASSGCGTWVDVLSVYKSVTELLSGVYQPTTEELNQGLLKMENSWSASLFYYGIIKGICGQVRPHTRLVGTALERFKRYSNFYAIKRIMEEDVDATTYQGTRSALVYASFTGMWEHAIHLYKKHPGMRQSITDTRSLINILSSNGRWGEAIKVLHQQPLMSMAPSNIKPIVRALGVAGKYDKMLRLVASSLAEGHQVNVSLFGSLVKPLQKSGQWIAALDAAADLGLFSSSREPDQRITATYTSLVDCLYSSDPYHNFTLHDVINDITYRMHPRDDSFGPPPRSDKTFRLLSTSEVHRKYRPLLNSLSNICAKVMSLNDLHGRPVSELADEAFKRGDVLLVFDTNFLIHCASKNLALSHFYVHIRKQYPHLEGKSLRRVIIPFTTVREAHQLVWNSAAPLKRAMRTLLWSRVTAILRDPSVEVLALSSEFPCISLSVISCMAYSRLNEMASENDPDLRILNTCVALQYAFRQRSAALLQGIEQISDGTMLFAFIKYHVRRHHRDVRGIACDQLLLCTMDKRLSLAADELGIQTFPRFQGLEEAAVKSEEN
ncbi:hypothetical protein, conserved [Trypanosoma brucei brucei TREU927]|uniref:PIN domain-containing protein n=1 Tax=Trypanosoma brucei brucei (strain 927/4 GUTat10.1) TaxID=185431 RepID=Q381G1_TRYB2|nr:hypothetical protein, conserved [Trypanosoma brucei brucei TREU927]EAN80570.1 hypothetical protein, conserved [Trypanosoma brucei brucei TREU927]